MLERKQSRGVAEDGKEGGMDGWRGVVGRGASRRGGTDINPAPI